MLGQRVGNLAAHLFAGAGNQRNFAFEREKIRHA
jgi:hypothetical protein